MMNRIAIIGAGIAGLSAATLLNEKGHAVDVFEKARGPGGRMSTRRSDVARLDHGAQYFTIRDPAFEAFLKRPVFKEAYAPWDARFSPSSDEKRYVGVPAMNQLCKSMAADQDVKLGCRIVKLQRRDNEWVLVDEKGDDYGPYDWVLSSAPPLQSAALLDGYAEFQPELPNIPMNPCFAVMMVFDRDLDFPADCIVFEDHELLRCVSLNHTKPGRGARFELVIQANHAWSRAHVDDDPAQVQDLLVQACERHFNVGLLNPLYAAIHRWLYSSPVQRSEQKFFIDRKSCLAAFGDWCLAARVECAFLSAKALCDEL